MNKCKQQNKAFKWLNTRLKWPFLNDKKENRNKIVKNDYKAKIIIKTRLSSKL